MQVWNVDKNDKPWAFTFKAKASSISLQVTFKESL